MATVLVIGVLMLVVPVMLNKSGQAFAPFRHRSYSTAQLDQESFEVAEIVAMATGCTHYGCGSYAPGRPCQCHRGCAASQDCCDDYKQVCKPTVAQRLGHARGFVAAETTTILATEVTSQSETIRPPVVPPTTLSTTTGITSTDALTWTSTTTRGAPSLFCFSVVRKASYEIQLVNAQHTNHASIFACEEYALFSIGGALQVGPLVTTEVSAPTVGMGDMRRAGTTTDSWLNTMIFMQAWDLVIAGGKWWEHDWTIKVDPDAVFFPDRLRKQIAPHTGGLDAEPQWVGNCDRTWHHSAPHLKLFGSLEVFSRNAIGAYKAFSGRCKTELHWKGWGEDMYMQYCMELVGARPINGTGFLGDKRCHYAPCTDVSKVAFHDFKDAQTYFDCWGQSRKVERQQQREQLASPVGQANPTVATAPASATASTWTSRAGLPSLFCFAVVRTASYETQLVNAQYSQKVSIFACEEHCLFSNGGALQVGGLAATQVFAPTVRMGDPGEAGTTTDSWLNTMIFMQVWDLVTAGGIWWKHDWTVKVDPDAVFFPERLRLQIGSHTGGPDAKPLWVGNCDRTWHNNKPHLKLFGSLEVFSRNAIGAYKAFKSRCKKELHWKGWGEDMYMQFCMELIGAHALNGTSFLGDQRCHYAPCTDVTKVAFHDFKDVQTYFDCWGQSRGSERYQQQQRERMEASVPAQTTAVAAKKERLSTNPWTWTSTTTPGPPSLFCFSVVRTASYETELVNAQYSQKLSIFACEEYSLFSNGGVFRFGDLATTQVSAAAAGMGEPGRAGTTTDSWLNTMIFMQAWDLVVAGGKWWKHDWTVKIDPDAVFFPDRLRAQIQVYTGGLDAEPLWVGNCDRTWHHSKPHLKLFGSLEVFSRSAIGAYKAFSGRCKKELRWKGWGEDMYMQFCMELIGVHAINGTGFLGDQRCRYAPCTDITKVAFHDFKNVQSYFDCWGQSQAAQHHPKRRKDDMEFFFKK